jgi:hypothetical protein
MDSFVTNPNEFIFQMIISQERDMKMAMSGNIVQSLKDEDERLAQFFTTPFLSDAVDMYIQNQNSFQPSDM